MPDVAKIYKQDTSSDAFVAAFGELVEFKVARVATFYDETGERLEPLLPSEEAVNFYKNPLLCAAVYYSNKGVPRARVRPSTLDGTDKNGMAVDEDLDRSTCGKKVGAHCSTYAHALPKPSVSSFHRIPYLSQLLLCRLTRQPTREIRRELCWQCAGIVGELKASISCRRSVRFTPGWAKALNGLVQIPDNVHSYPRCFYLARRDVYALLKRYFVPTGKEGEEKGSIRVYFDHSCSLSEVVLNRDPEAACHIDNYHDKYVQCSSCIVPHLAHRRRTHGVCSSVDVDFTRKDTYDAQ
jgi:hypothetical protein